MIKNKILKLIRRAIIKLQAEGLLVKFDIPEIQLEYPQEERYGDYATNIALQLRTKVHREPNELGSMIVSQIKTIAPKSLFEKIEVVSPGFINFTLSPEFLARELKKIVSEGKKFGKSNFGKGKKVQVEFISANPTGPLHLGNGRGAFWGDTLSKALKKVGYKVQKEYLINDVGRQVDILGESVTRRYLQSQGIKVPYPDNCYQGKYIDDLAKKLKLRNYKLNNSKKVEKIKERIKEIALKEMLKDIKRVAEDKLKIKFDSWFSERTLYEKKTSDKVFDFLKQKKLIYEEDGATWLRTKDYGDEKDRVLIKADGESTYFFSDIAYHWNKFKIRKFKKVIDVWGADHAGHVRRMQAAMEGMGEKGKLDIIVYQLVRLMEGEKEKKMSKRKGEFVTLEELIDEVGLDAARFFFLMYAAGTHMDFDLNLAKKKSSKNPVYYVQYAHARICSIINKLKEKKLKVSEQKTLKLEKKLEIKLVMELLKYPEVLEKVSTDYEVQNLPFYAISLAENFHYFYTHCKVIDNGEVNYSRLQLIKATQMVFQNVLEVMGIEAPREM